MPLRTGCSTFTPVCFRNTADRECTEWPRYVFPDGELQDISVTIGAMQDIGLEVRDVESLREHYAKTLRYWVANLEKNWSKAVELVGEARTRVWWIYMVGSAVSFEANRISIHQTLATKTERGRSGMPLTRAEFV